MQNLSDVFTQLSGFLVELGAARHVGDQGRHEDILITEGERGALGVDGLHAFRGVSIERDQGVVEDRSAADTLGEDLVGFLLRGHVVRLEVVGEPRVHGPVLLTGSGSRSDADPFGEVSVAAALGFNGNGAHGVEGSSVGGVDGLGAFLHDQNLDDGLEVIIRHWHGRNIKREG